MVNRTRIAQTFFKYQNESPPKTTNIPGDIVFVVAIVCCFIESDALHQLTKQNSYNKNVVERSTWEEMEVNTISNTPVNEPKREKKVNDLLC